MESALDPFTILKDCKPPPPDAVIRPFNAETDTKVARYIIGASISLVVSPMSFLAALC